MMRITFPGGLAVDAEYKGLTIHTDQPVAYGGSGTAAAPFDLFLASIGTCAGFYALRFCQERGISTEGMGLTLSTELDSETKRIGTIRLELQLPDEFPDKYRPAILSSLDQCTVKRHIVDAPRFVWSAVVPELVAAGA